MPGNGKICGHVMAGPHGSRGEPGCGGRKERASEKERGRRSEGRGERETAECRKRTDTGGLHLNVWIVFNGILITFAPW